MTRCHIQCKLVMKTAIENLRVLPSVIKTKWCKQSNSCTAWFKSTNPWGWPFRCMTTGLSNAFYSALFRISILACKYDEALRNHLVYRQSK